MPSQEEHQFTQTSNNFTQGQSSQLDSDSAFLQVCRLYEQSQQEHQEMMSQLMNMKNHRAPHQQHSRLTELQKTRPPVFSHTDK